MRGLLLATCVALLLGGCAGRSRTLTPHNVKRGNAALYVAVGGPLRWNTNYSVYIMIQGNDSRFGNRLGYVMTLTDGGEEAKFTVWPQMKRWYVIKAPVRGGTRTRGSVTYTVTLSPVLGYDWKGDLSIGPPFLQAQAVVQIVDLEAD